MARGSKRAPRFPHDTLIRPAGLTEPWTKDGWARFFLAGLPWLFSVQIEQVDGAPQITGLRLAREPWPDMYFDRDSKTLVETMEVSSPVDAVITAERLRRLPLKTIRAVAIGITNVDSFEASQAMLERSDERPQGEAWQDEHYRDVADEYRHAVANGRPPLAAIGERWHVGRAMASKYVRRARELHYLDWPARRGVAGASEPVSPFKKAKSRGRTPR